MNLKLRCCCGALVEFEDAFESSCAEMTRKFFERHAACRLPKPCTLDAVPSSPTLPYVLEFAQAMEGKLALNRHKGDSDGWRKESVADLCRCLRQEVEELGDAVCSKGPGEVLGEAADVANFAMMIADVFQRAAKSAS